MWNKVFSLSNNCKGKDNRIGVDHPPNRWGTGAESVRNRRRDGRPWSLLARVV